MQTTRIRPLAGFADQYVAVQGIRLRFWQAGESGATVLLLHGVNGCVENWRWNLGAIGERHRAYALDGPGHGLSQPDPRAYDLHFMRDLMVAFLDSQQVERTSLVALSGGGLVALAMALEVPQRVDRLVLVDSAGLGRGIHAYLRFASIVRRRRAPLHISRDQLQSWLTRYFFSDQHALTEPMLDDFYANISREHTMQTAGRMIRWGVNLWGQKVVFASRLDQIKVPTLIVWGRQDRLLPVSHAYRAARIIPGARLVVFDPCGHLPPMERSAEFNQMLLEFL